MTSLKPRPSACKAPTADDERAAVAGHRKPDGLQSKPAARFGCAEIDPTMPDVARVREQDPDRTPCSAPCACCATRACLSFRRGHAVKVTGTPERGAVHAKATELLQLARRHGYHRKELIELIPQLP